METLRQAPYYLALEDLVVATV